MWNWATISWRRLVLKSGHGYPDIKMRVFHGQTINSKRQCTLQDPRKGLIPQESFNEYMYVKISNKLDVLFMVNSFYKENISSQTKKNKHLARGSEHKTAFY